MLVAQKESLGPYDCCGPLNLRKEKVTKSWRKDLVSSPRKMTWSENPLSAPSFCLPFCPFIFNRCFDKNQGEKDVFVRNFLGFPRLYGETQWCFGQVSFFISLLWHTIQSHSGCRKWLPMISLSKEHVHWKMGFGKLTCFPLALKRPLNEKASLFEILV